MPDCYSIRYGTTAVQASVWFHMSVFYAKYTASTLYRFVFIYRKFVIICRSCDWPRLFAAFQVKANFPEEYASRELDKLRYRYPRGESYLDIIARLEPVIFEMERQKAPLLIIAHQVGGGGYVGGWVGGRVGGWMGVCTNKMLPFPSLSCLLVGN